ESQRIIANMGTNVLSVWPQSQQRTGAANLGIGATQNMKLEDAQAVLEECPDVLAVAPEYSGQLRAKYMNQNTRTNVVGTTTEYFDIRNYKLADGEFFTHADNERRAKVCVIGDSVRDSLFGDNVRPVGKTFKIRGQNFEVI